ncbi:MAG: hypothetical protein ACNYWU_03470 [Desulfobacterales bacterium]
MLKSDTILLALFLGNREYYCDKTIYFGISMFKDIILNTSTSGDLASKLKEKGFTHLIIAFLLFGFFQGGLIMYSTMPRNRLSKRCF